MYSKVIEIDPSDVEAPPFCALNAEGGLSPIHKNKNTGSALDGEDNTIFGSTKQAWMSGKHCFMEAPKRVQYLTIGVAVALLWVLISEEFVASADDGKED